jgi:hypothetical protein
VCAIGMLSLDVTTVRMSEIDVLLMILFGNNCEKTSIYMRDKTDRKCDFEIQLQCGKFIENIRQTVV